MSSCADSREVQLRLGSAPLELNRWECSADEERRGILSLRKERKQMAKKNGKRCSAKLKFPLVLEAIPRGGADADRGSD